MKISILIPVVALAVSFMAGCVCQEKAKEEKNKALIRADFEEVWNQGKLDVIDDIYDTNFIKHTPGIGSPDIHGPGGLKQSVNMFRTAFPDGQFMIEDQITEGNKVVNHWIGSGTHEGELLGIPPTGIQLKWTGVAIYRFADGKIVEVWIYSDIWNILKQFAVNPPIGQGE